MKFNNAPVVLWGRTGHRHRHSTDERLHESAWRSSKPVPCQEECATISCDTIPDPSLHFVLERAARRCPSVTIDAEVMDGQPCVTGTRVPVRSVLRAIENSGSVNGAILCYPHLKVHQVKDALYFSQLVLEWPSGADEVTVID